MNHVIRPHWHHPRACVDALVAVGVHRLLGLSETAYRHSLPKLVPENPRPDLCDRLVLVDRRPGIAGMAGLLGVQADRKLGDALVDFHDRAYPYAEFLWCQDGRRNKGRSILACRDSFVKGAEIGLTCIEGLCLYAQDRSVTDAPDDHVMDMPGTVHEHCRSGAAILYRQGGQVRLEWGNYTDTNAQCGSASRLAA